MQRHDPTTIGAVNLLFPSAALAALWGAIEAHHRHQTMWMIVFIVGIAGVAVGYAELCRLNNLSRE